MYTSSSKSLTGTFANILALISSVQAVNRRGIEIPLHRRQTQITGPATYDAGFWFANITIGASKDPVQVLIDTGSADLVLNPGLYKASSASIDLYKSFNVTYGTVTSDSSSGSSSETITGSLYNDTVLFQSLTLPNQTIGIIPSISNTTSTSIYPHNGIVGLGDPSLSGSNSTPYFHNLCDQHLVSECRFGLALSTNGSGSLTLGALDTDLVSETSLTKVPIIQEWATFGDIAVNGKIVEKDALLEFDSGSSGIIGPISAIETLFNLTNIQSVLIPSAAGNTLVGYYPCSTLPTIGLSLPSQSNLTSPASSNSSTIFNLETSTLSMGHEGNNCTSVISGFDYGGKPGLWVIGQAFFEGKYLDHDLENGILGVAQLNGGNRSSMSSPPKAMATLTSGASRMEVSALGGLGFMAAAWAML
ncbi:hypothetical protein NHQ30_006586 [Ciborinia camelliae]|nr:hypothetical protein NHQ30_006586 [Ciborinia camelliae]